MESSTEKRTTIILHGRESYSIIEGCGIPIVNRRYPAPQKRKVKDDINNAWKKSEWISNTGTPIVKRKRQRK